jgi:His/Glu/Gln/Arg/opine family amino acid ABC transporter permease subunit
MNLELIAEYWPQIWSGFQTTIVLSIIVIGLSTPLAFLLAVVRHTRVPVIAPIASVYVHLFRALPALVVLFFAFYALPRLGLRLQPLPAAIIGMVLTSTAYMSEDFRAGLAAIAREQWQAADALGLSRSHTVRRIILPQAIPIMIPPFMTNTIITVKATSIASLVGVNELTGASMAAMSLTYSALDFLLLAAILYLAISAVLAVLQEIAERWVGRIYTAAPKSSAVSAI